MGWVAWIASWLTPTVPICRRYREILINILIENPLEFRIALLTHQIRRMFSYKV